MALGVAGLFEVSWGVLVGWISLGEKACFDIPICWLSRFSSYGDELASYGGGTSSLDFPKSWGVEDLLGAPETGSDEGSLPMFATKSLPL